MAVLSYLDSPLVGHGVPGFIATVALTVSALRKAGHVA